MTHPFQRAFEMGIEAIEAIANLPLCRVTDGERSFEAHLRGNDKWDDGRAVVVGYLQQLPEDTRLNILAEYPDAQAFETSVPREQVTTL